MEDTQSEKLSWFRNSPLKEPNPLPLHCLIAVKTPPVNYFHSQLRCLTKNYLNNCVNKRLLLFITNALFSSFFKICLATFPSLQLEFQPSSTGPHPSSLSSDLKATWAWKETEKDQSTHVVITKPAAN